LFVSNHLRCSVSIVGQTNAISGLKKREASTRNLRIVKNVNESSTDKKLGRKLKDFRFQILLLCTIYNTYSINSIAEITSLIKKEKNITNTSPK